MASLSEFIDAIKSEFPDDRLTWQKGIATFHPETADEAAALFRLAGRHDRKIFITGFGNNIDPQGEPFSEIVTIRTDRLNQCCNVSKEDFFITVGGGYPLREINHRLKRDELYFPHASLPYVGSVGGAIAVGLTASLHEHDVPLKKYLIMAEIVTPAGEIIRPGSTTFKSVSGYDVVKIFHGSWGLLGLIVTATFRIMPAAGADDFAAMTQAAIERKALLDYLVESNRATDAEYSRKIKEKFDPQGLLPTVP